MWETMRSSFLQSQNEDVMKSKLFMGIGWIMVAAAVFLMISNMRESRQAGTAAENMVAQMESLETELPEQLASESEEFVPEYEKNPEMEMPTVEIDGQECIGTIEIPALELKLPVISEWSNEKLKKAPCRYSGSAYLNNLIIAGHNYRTHFSGIKYLKVDDEVIFRDTAGNEFSYSVSAIEKVDEHDIEEMESGDWDLTLFTCTKGGRARVAVRCKERK